MVRFIIAICRTTTKEKTRYSNPPTIKNSLTTMSRAELMVMFPSRLRASDEFIFCVVVVCILLLRLVYSLIEVTVEYNGYHTSFFL